MREFNFRKLAGVLLTATVLSGCAPMDMGMDEFSSGEEEVVEVTKPLAVDDYYGYINFDKIQNTTFDYGESAGGSFYDLQKLVNEQQKSIINEIGKSTEQFAPGTNEQLIHDYYQQVLSFNGSADVMAELKADIATVREKTDIGSLLQYRTELAYKYGLSTLPSPMVTRDHKNPDTYAIYLGQMTDVCGSGFEDMMKNDNACASLQAFSKDMLMAVGDEAQQAAKDADDLVYLAVELARNTDIKLAYVDDIYGTFEFVSEAEVNALFPSVGTSLSELIFGRNNPYGGYYVQDKKQLETLGRVMSDEYLNEWKTWTVTEMVNCCGSFINDQNTLLETYFSFKDDEARMEYFFGSALEEELGEIYAERYYTPEMDTELNHMFEEIRGSYRELISGAEWLSETARASLLRKLGNIRLVSGCTPHEVNSSDASLIGSYLFRTACYLNYRYMEYMVNLLGTPYEPSVMEMTPQTVNACYNVDNTVTITVAIMNEPFFDVDRDYYANLGGLGTVVGHEVGHAFDSNCMDFDENGRYNPEWLPEADRKVLSERADTVTEYFDEYTIMDVYHVDGELTNGENYADLGGVECVVNITEGEKNLRTLFESYAGIWCGVGTDEDAIMMLSFDVHSPDRVRVNAVLSSCDKFYEVYGIREGDGMYKAPEERVSRW